MGKIIEIKNCIMCPYASDKYETCNKLFKPMKLNIDTVSRCEIPSWCPLPDAESKEVKK